MLRSDSLFFLTSFSMNLLTPISEWSNNKKGSIWKTVLFGQTLINIDPTLQFSQNQ